MSQKKRNLTIFIAISLLSTSDETLLLYSQLLWLIVQVKSVDDWCHVRAGVLFGDGQLPSSGRSRLGIDTLNMSRCIRMVFCKEQVKGTNKCCNSQGQRKLDQQPARPGRGVQQTARRRLHSPMICYKIYTRRHRVVETFEGVKIWWVRSWK